MSLSIPAMVAAEILNDDEDDTERLISDYEGSTERERWCIDNAFISLCGWSLKTLIERSRS